ncbi:hypothetical protein SLS64_012401 [Diaporthe eres]
MRFSTIQGITLALFEDLPNVPALGVGLGSTAQIPNGYSGLNWANLYGVTPSPTAHFATAPNSPATNPAVISATQGRTLNPEAIFVGTFQTGVVGGAAALSSASTITVTATFQDATTAQTTFNFDPPNTVFGLAISAEAMQYFQFPCEWAKVVSLSFRPQAENGLNGLLGLAIDNFQYIDDTSA